MGTSFSSGSFLTNQNPFGESPPPTC
jgi:hypothetical protein